MKFNKHKCKVLHLGKHNPGVHHRLGSTWLGSSSMERDLGVLVDNKLNMSEQCAAVAKKANRMLGCIKGITSIDKEVIIPLHSALATHGILCSVLIPAIQKRCGQAGEGPEKGHKDDQRTGKPAICVSWFKPSQQLTTTQPLAHPPPRQDNEERLRELGLFSLEKRRLRGDLITMFRYLKGGYKEDGDSLFTRSDMEKTRGNGYKLLLGRFRLDTREQFFIMRTISHWNNLPREVVDSPTLDTLRFGWTGCWAILPRPCFCQERLDQMILEVPSNLVFYDSMSWKSAFSILPVPMLDNPFSEVKFPNIQSKPPLVQLEAISSCPITCYLGEETNPHLSTTSFQVVVESDKVFPQPPFLQAKQPQFPQPLLIRLVFQTLHQLHCPSLDTVQHLNVLLVVRGPKVNTVFKVWPHQCRVQGHDHFPSPAGHTIPDTSQDAVGFLGHLGTLLAHIQAPVNQHPQVLFCQAAFQPLFPKPVALHGVVVTQVQDPTLGLVKPHTIDLGPLIQPVQVPLQSLPPLKQINTPAQLGVICKLTESALDPFIQIIDKDIKQNWPQN
ncbi:LOW QUALITY PROTEIN: hypothetical protein QYF61_007464 [Mycteria americana]|uniref:Uncharacterized protein n=1 Tax=Mycteria americana TaxID=33587 RepID=A0AAN7RKN4_MYCAM|nr:LOW QUALITY PROTEIN: hypothetical protein QYF61_007464 [Mycteria americana]